MSKEAMVQALELIRAWERVSDSDWAPVVYYGPLKDAVGGFKAIEEALAQPVHARVCLPY